MELTTKQIKHKALMEEQTEVKSLKQVIKKRKLKKKVQKQSRKANR